MHRFPARLAVALLFSPLAACVKEISSEERLERATRGAPVKDTLNEAALAKVNCNDGPSEVAKARLESRPETERLTAYMDLYESLKRRQQSFESAMSRNPDLAYQESSRELVAAKDLCVQQTADVRVEFERYVRELVDVPTVQEVKGGNTVTVARLDFEALKEAIEKLDPDDREQLLARVASAERKVEVKKEAPARRGKK